MKKKMIQGLVLALAVSSSAMAAEGRLLATGGATSVEGSAGGGLVPWAVISGYTEDDEIGGTVAVTRAQVDDYRLDVTAASFSFRNRLEVSVASQILNLENLGTELRQQTFGLKYRVAGDLIYGDLPQISAGVQYKRNTRYDLPEAVGSQRDSDWDAYLAASRVWLAGPFNRTWLANVTVRATRANQFGLLGYGGDLNDSRELQVEAAAGMFLNRGLAVGLEYRQKPDNLGFAEEEDAMSAFVAWFPSKNVSLVGAYVDLGSIAGANNQTGYYLSLQASF
ncbi:DUF3034 domain-containing protein [Aliidiomarina iranensis]|uniref:DUF3034 domain-containing protein n=1 Tax=Aliidiomarina iranensis TaxID=1434071 RepID=A0A432VX14_9GAMM|nr:DUF3034 family protein [Aliidiomarina iranensis]RUO21220.1 DUF3034 domain-containing protein [Aliidiomarina iranensis]